LGLLRGIPSGTVCPPISCGEPSSIFGQLLTLPPWAIMRPSVLQGTCWAACWCGGVWAPWHSWRWTFGGRSGSIITIAVRLDVDAFLTRRQPQLMFKPRLDLLWVRWWDVSWGSSGGLRVGDLVAVNARLPASCRSIGHNNNLSQEGELDVRSSGMEGWMDG